MKILWLTIDRSYRVTQHFDTFREAVSELVDVKSLFKMTKPYKSGDFSKVVMAKRIKPPKYLNKSLANENFDLIMCDAFFAYGEEDWDLFKCPKGILIEDVHTDVPKWQVKIAKEVGIDVIFHRYSDAFHTHHPDAGYHYKCIWLPHCVDIDTFFDYNIEQAYVFHLGCVDDHYPYRNKAIKALSGWNEFKAINRPEESMDNGYKWPINGKYAELISSAKICVTGGSKYNVPVLKYFEIPACNTVLMSNWFSDLSYLGFYPNENMIVYDEDILSQVKELYGDEDRLKKIANNGMRLILDKHTVKKRAINFINDVKSLV